MGKERTTPAARPTVKHVKELEERIRALEDKKGGAAGTELEEIKTELGRVSSELGKLEKLLVTPAGDPEPEVNPETSIEDPEDDPDPDSDEDFWKDL